MTNINLTPILQALIGVVAALITYRLVPWIKENTTKAQQEQLQAALRIAVYAAEQVYGAGHGEEKLDSAIKWLRDQGYDVDRVQIEAKVYELINGPKAVVQSLPVAVEETAIEETVDE